MVFTVGFQKRLSVCIAFQIIIQRPKPPEQVKMPVSNAAFTRINGVYGRKIGKHYVWKAIIAVKHAVGAEILLFGKNDFYGFVPVAN